MLLAGTLTKSPGYRTGAVKTRPYYECSSDSEEPAVEADCPEECERGSYEVDGTMKYYCGCRAWSAEECAEKYPGEQPHRAVT